MERALFFCNRLSSESDCTGSDWLGTACGRTSLRQNSIVCGSNGNCDYRTNGSIWYGLYVSEISEQAVKNFVNRKCDEA